MNVIMFHSVGNTGSKWYRNWLSVELLHFEMFCKYLSKNNYRTIFLEEWYFLQNNPGRISGEEIVLTFDDGYLDNWIYAYPVLKKYGLKGTVFISPEFVDKSTGLRPNLFEISNKPRWPINTLGFLNWEEIKELDQSGVVDIQSHSMSHNFYFSTNKIIDIYTGQKEYDWLAWNTNPDRKHLYLTEDQSNLIPYGQPIFEFGRALGVRRYFPDKEIHDLGMKQYNGNNFPKEEIISHLKNNQKKYPGRYETDQEMEQRYSYEIFESKRILEEKLNKNIDFLCWPGGGYNDLSIQLSIQAGYKASTIASREKKRMFDNSAPYKRIQRFGMGSLISKKKGRVPARLQNHLVYSFHAKKGKLLPRIILKMQKFLV